MNKEIEMLIKNINTYRSNLNMTLIKLNEEEYELLSNFYKKIENKALMQEILINYYFNNSIKDYIKILEKIIDSTSRKEQHLKSKKDELNILNIENTSKPENLNKTEKSIHKLQVDDKSLLDIINSYFDNSFHNDRGYYYLKDKSIGVLTMQSKVYKHSSYKYWYTYHDYQKSELAKYKERYMLLYFKDTKDGLIIPTSFIEQYREKLGKSIYEKTHDIGIHIYIEKKNSDYFLRIPYEPLVPLNDFKLRQEKFEVIKISSNYKQVNIKKKR